MKQRYTYLPMHLFPMLKEIAFLNKWVLIFEYPDGYTSTEILFRGSKDLPRKQKKYLRKLIKHGKKSNI